MRALTCLDHHPIGPKARGGARHMRFLSHRPATRSHARPAALSESCAAPTEDGSARSSLLAQERQYCDALAAERRAAAAGAEPRAPPPPAASELAVDDSSWRALRPAPFHWHSTANSASARMDARPSKPPPTRPAYPPCTQARPAALPRLRLCAAAGARPLQPGAPPPPPLPAATHASAKFIC